MAYLSAASVWSSSDTPSWSSDEQEKAPRAVLYPKYPSPYTWERLGLERGYNPQLNDFMEVHRLSQRWRVHSLSLKYARYLLAVLSKSWLRSSVAKRIVVFLVMGQVEP